MVSSIASVAASLFIKTLIDDYIMPLIGVENPDFSGLLSAIIGMIALFLVGIVCTLGYNRLMANVSQGVLKNIRDEMFGHMQSLPIKYFDTHTHGDVMSYYTNDTDALRLCLILMAENLNDALTVYHFLNIAVYIAERLLLAHEIRTGARSDLTRGKKPPFKLDVKIMGRIFGYMKPFKAQLILVAICIVVSSIARARSDLTRGKKHYTKKRHNYERKPYRNAEHGSENRNDCDQRSEHLRKRL